MTPIRTRLMSRHSKSFVITAATLFLTASIHSAYAQQVAPAGPIDPPFVGTIEDGAHVDAFFRKDYSWYVRKRFIARIVQRVLLSRGFETKSAAYIAANWDAWRFNPETGERLYFGRALKINESQAVAFAHTLPECLKDLGKSFRQTLYSTEYGCRYQPGLVLWCQRLIQRLNSTFALLFDPNPTADLRDRKLYPFGQHVFYPLTCNITWGGQGADLVVYAPLLNQATKLAFNAVKRAEVVTTTPPSVAATVRPRVESRSCSAVGIIESGGTYSEPWGSAEVKGFSWDRGGEGSIPNAEWLDEQFNNWVMLRRWSRRSVLDSVVQNARSVGISAKLTSSP